MKIDLNTPEKAIISLETAYTDKDLSTILIIKDFESEAKIILKRTNNPISNEIIREVAELLKLSLIDNVNKNGFPSFENVTRVLTNLKHYDEKIYLIEEKLTYSDGVEFMNKLYLTKNDKLWKVSLTE
jgi:NifB/MoaA-like Fe-S oxidoreductase